MGQYPRVSTGSLRHVTRQIRPHFRAHQFAFFANQQANCSSCIPTIKAPQSELSKESPHDFQECICMGGNPLRLLPLSLQMLLHTLSNVVPLTQGFERRPAQTGTDARTLTQMMRLLGIETPNNAASSKLKEPAPGEAKRPTCIIPFHPGGVRSGLLDYGRSHRALILSSMLGSLILRNPVSEV